MEEAVREAKLSKQEKINEVRNRAIKRASAFQRVFTSPDGKVVLNELAAVFGRPKLYVPGDSYGTHVRVGNLEVLQYISEVMGVETDA